MNSSLKNLLIGKETNRNVGYVGFENLKIAPVNGWPPKPIKKHNLHCEKQSNAKKLHFEKNVGYRLLSEKGRNAFAICHMINV